MPTSPTATTTLSIRRLRAAVTGRVIAPDDDGLASFAVSGRLSDDELAEFYLRHDDHWL